MKFDIGRISRKFFNKIPELVKTGPQLKTALPIKSKCVAYCRQRHAWRNTQNEWRRFHCLLQCWKPHAYMNNMGNALLSFHGNNGCANALQCYAIVPCLHAIPWLFIIIKIIIIIIIIYLSWSWATCWPVPVSRIQKSLQRSTMIPSASWGVVFHYPG